MLHYFRKYQQYIFIFITIVIVISFSFFGTYSALQRSTYEDPVVFTAVDGTKVTRSELEQFTAFVGTDMEEKRNYGGVWGPNFLNDGVIKKNFLENGVLEIIAEQYKDQIAGELGQKLEKERNYALYSHPQAKFIGLDSAWNYFVPYMKQNYDTLKSSSDPLDPQAFNARVKLFLGERQFPAPLARHMLRMQEKLYTWVEHDQALDYGDLSLFGYHRAEDWFGPKLMRLASEFIINSAIIAEQRGYRVSPSEAMADLMRNAALSFKQNQQSPEVRSVNVDQYMNEQLMRMGIDKNIAIKIWQQVLLFRRLYEDMGNSVFTDPFSFEGYDAYANKTVEGQMYQLPRNLQFGDARSLEKFETYLDAVSAKPRKGKGQLEMPQQYKTAEQLQKTAPELVQKRYLLDVAEVSKKDLGSKVSLKEMWQWQSSEKNWKLLTEKFPELAQAKAQTEAARLEAIDNLSDASRARVDNFTREAIVASHPEWVKEALDSATPQVMTVSIPLQGGNIFAKGVSDRGDLIHALDAAPLAGDGAKEGGPLSMYSGDDQHFYRIDVIDRSPSPEVMTFSEANSTGVLDELTDKQMKAYYEKIRSKYPKEFQNEDGSWKSFTGVSDTVAGHYYGDLMENLGDYYVEGVVPKGDNENLSMSRAASLRFVKHFVEAKQQLEANPTAGIVAAAPSETPENKLPPRQPLADQWKLVASHFETSRSSPNTLLDKQEALSLKEGDWSKIYTPANGDLYFYHVDKVEVRKDEDTLAKQVRTIHAVLSNEAQLFLAKRMLGIMQEKGALSVEFLQPRMKETQ